MECECCEEFHKLVERLRKNVEDFKAGTITVAQYLGRSDIITLELIEVAKDKDD